MNKSLSHSIKHFCNRKEVMRRISKAIEYFKQWEFTCVLHLFIYTNHINHQSVFDALGDHRIIKQDHPCDKLFWLFVKLFLMVFFSVVLWSQTCCEHERILCVLILSNFETGVTQMKQILYERSWLQFWKDTCELEY